MTKWRFLIADHNEGARTLLVSHLKASFPGCKTHEAGSGADAVSLLREMEHRPVMAFYAHDMPDMSSIGFLGESRQLGTKTTIPTVIVGKDLGNEKVMSLYRLGASIVLGRPTKRHEVKEAARDVARVTVRAA